MTIVATTPPSRFVSLDVFRGATIFLMILVNTAGPGAPAYPLLVHAQWFGFTMADLVFPTFLFAMGNAMSFARLRQISDTAFLARLARRAAIIFVLGYLMYWYPFVEHNDAGWAVKPWSETRIPGVLQRIALCYVCAGLLTRWLDWRWLPLISIGLLAAYWGILLGFSLPGAAYDKFGNAGTRLDLFLFGPAHLYRKDGGFDPEGLLGTIPATVNVLAGYLAGLAVQRRADLPRCMSALMLAGILLMGSGLAWSPWFPIAKKLWTGSFVLLTVGLDLVLLVATIWLVELHRVRTSIAFFVVLGRNPLAIYLFSELFVTTLNLVPVPPYHGLYGWLGIAVFQAIAPGSLGSLLCALLYTLVCWAFGLMMDRAGLILKA